MTIFGHTPACATQSEPADAKASTKIRVLANLGCSEGPTDALLEDALAGFVGQFDYWFTRVILHSVSKYRILIISRINPLVRKIETGDLDPESLGSRLVSDYVNRNYVTAGGWAIEKLAVSLSEKTFKSSSRGIDIQRNDQNGDQHLYVVKSGKVTRNSDILNRLKQHIRDAEQLVRQGELRQKKNGKAVAPSRVSGYYVVATGQTNDTFADGVYRPSSASFWAAMSELPPDKALDLVSAICTVSKDFIDARSNAHVDALKLLVSDYIMNRQDDSLVDWDFLFDRTMKDKSSWKHEDQSRNSRALRRLKETGYTICK